MRQKSRENLPHPSGCTKGIHSLDLQWCCIPLAQKRIARMFPAGETECLWLSYEAENHHGRRVYRKYGFVENGQFCDGEIVAVKSL